MSTLLSLARHGTTPWHADNRYCGSSDVGLTPEGDAQARALGRWAARARPDAVACSPLLRSRRTAAPAAAALEREPLVVADLREQHFGLAEGITLDELELVEPGAARAFRTDPVANPFPRAEQPEAVADRVRDALLQLAAGHPGGHLLVVGHNTALRLALCRLLGIEVRRYRDVLPRLDNGALTQVRVDPASGSAALLMLNTPVDDQPDPEDPS